MLPSIPPMHSWGNYFHILNTNQTYPHLVYKETISIGLLLYAPRLPNKCSQIAAHGSQDPLPPCILHIPYFSEVNCPSLRVDNIGKLGWLWKMDGIQLGY
jgi:hypothetical protein